MNWRERLKKNILANAQSATDKNRQKPHVPLLSPFVSAVFGESKNIFLDSSQPVTVWELLQNDWQTITQVCKEAQDRDGLIVVMAREGGTCQATRLDKPNTLQHALTQLAKTYPQPLELQLLAVRDDHATLRVRYKKTMVGPCMVKA